MKSESDNNLIYHWIGNLVGSNSAFLLNLFVSLTFGLLYSFKILPSPYILLLFGVISPVIFTICLYFFLGNYSSELLGNQLPSAFKSRAGNKLLMLFDISLIVGFALLIFFDYLNYFVFRFLQTVFFPGMLLVLLRVLYISKELEKFNNNDEETDFF